MKDSTTQNHRAAQIWSVLVFAARHQEIITYATIERLTGLPRYTQGPALDRISDYCNWKKFPELWSIVVNEKTGFPGSKGMEREEELDVLLKQRRVFAFNWLEHNCPQSTDFKDAHSKA
jgi:hypothetical protein